MSTEVSAGLWVQVQVQCTLHLIHFVMPDAYVVTWGVAGLGLGVQVQVRVQATMYRTSACTAHYFCGHV